MSENESIRGGVCLAKLKARSLKIMSELTPSRTFSRKFTEIYTEYLLRKKSVWVQGSKVLPTDQHPQKCTLDPLSTE